MLHLRLNYFDCLKYKAIFGYLSERKIKLNKSYFLNIQDYEYSCFVVEM